MLSSAIITSKDCIINDCKTKNTQLSKVEIVMSSLEFTATNKILLLFSSIDNHILNEILLQILQGKLIYYHKYTYNLKKHPSRDVFFVSKSILFLEFFIQHIILFI